MKQRLPFAFRNRSNIKNYHPTCESMMYNEVISEPCMPSIKGSMLRELFQNQLGMFGESNCMVCLSKWSTAKISSSFVYCCWRLCHRWALLSKKKELFLNTMNALNNIPKCIILMGNWTFLHFYARLHGKIWNFNSFLSSKVCYFNKVLWSIICSINAQKFNQWLILFLHSFVGMYGSKYIGIWFGLF